MTAAGRADIVLVGNVLTAGADIIPAGTAPTVATLVNDWLIAHGGGSEHTYRAYQRAIGKWLTWCQEQRIDPLAASRADLDTWQRVTAQIPTQRGTLPSKATMAALVSAIASFYRYLVEEGVIDVFPIRSRTRPRAPRDSQTVGMSIAEAAALETYLAGDLVTPLERAVLLTLLWQGLRISELIGLRVDALRPDAGHHTMLVHGKGGKVRRLPIEACVHTAIEALLTARFGVDDRPGDAHVFTDHGNPLCRVAVTRDIKRITRAAGIASHRLLSPHSFRHTCTTLMLDAGAPLAYVQEFLGHASADTTTRYDRARGRLNRAVDAQTRMRRSIAEHAATRT